MTSERVQAKLDVYREGIGKLAIGKLDGYRFDLGKSEIGKTEYVCCGEVSNSNKSYKW